jgi:hypothetical protein
MMGETLSEQLNDTTNLPLDRKQAQRMLLVIANWDRIAPVMRRMFDRAPNEAR